MKIVLVWPLLLICIIVTNHVHLCFNHTTRVKFSLKKNQKFNLTLGGVKGPLALLCRSSNCE